VEQIKRKRLGSKAWREVLERFAKSNDSVRVFCQREGLSAETFRRWRTRLAPTCGPAAVAVGGQCDAPHFVDLGSLGAGPAALPVSGASTDIAGRFELKLDLGNGMSLVMVRG
jgi:hypothetical protein